jgi:uncharacterized protein YecA (UPF0149 family)
MVKLLERLFSGNKVTEEEKAEMGRNDVCWCGSGKKYKRCHLDSDSHKQRMRHDLNKTKKK